MADGNKTIRWIVLLKKCKYTYPEEKPPIGENRMSYAAAPYFYKDNYMLSP
jgi:hypothetical protein